MLLVGLLWPGLCMAQFEADSIALLDTISQVNSNISRLGINTYALRNYAGSGTLRLGRHQASGLILTDHVYNTAQDGANKFVTADVLTSLQYRQYWGPDWSLLAYGHVQDYGANRNRLAWMGTGVKFSKRILDGQDLSIRGVAELMADKRSDLVNGGPAYETALQYKAVLDTTAVLSIGGRIWQAFITPRQHQAYLAFGRISKEFSKQAITQLMVGYRGRKIEDYLNMGDGLNIQSIVSDTFTSELKLQYVISDRWAIRSYNSMTLPNRSFDYRTYTGPVLRQNSYYRQTDWDLKQSLFYQTDLLFVEGRVEYIYRDRAYGVKNNLGLPLTELDKVLALERVKDITEVIQAWYTNWRFAPTDKQQFTLATIAQLLRVDTRSEDNNQDRDEAFYTIEGSYRYVWNKWFRTEFKTSGSYKHLVYITASQSIENFQERILRFEPSFAWTPGRLSLTGNHSLFVTYHVRDFMTEQGKNRSNRILLSNIQTRYRFNKQYAAQVDILRRENRLGQLNWKAFSESPIDTVVIWDVTAKAQKGFVTSKGSSYRLDLGYRLFRQGRTSTAGINDGGGAKLAFVNNIVLQHGPIMTLAIETLNGFSLSTDLWIQSTAIYNDFTVSGSSFTGPSFTTEQLGQVQRNFFPNFSLSLNWNINRPRNWKL